MARPVECGIVASTLQYNLTNMCLFLLGNEYMTQTIDVIDSFSMCSKYFHA